MVEAVILEPKREERGALGEYKFFPAAVFISSVASEGWYDMVDAVTRTHLSHSTDLEVLTIPFYLRWSSMRLTLILTQKATGTSRI